MIRALAPQRQLGVLRWYTMDYTSFMQSSVQLRYNVPRASQDWVLSEEPVPESQPHDLVLDLLKALLLAWTDRLDRPLQVARNLAFRWDEQRPSMGVDPDLLVFDRTPEGDSLESLCLWKPGHRVPCLAIEVVSTSNARKDYLSAPAKYAASGVKELWIFDPRQLTPAADGRFKLQLFHRDADGGFTRLYAGEGPMRSSALDAWVFVAHDGDRLRIAADEAGTAWWMTREEEERAAKERERADKETERAAKERERVAKETERAAKECERAAKERERAAKENERAEKEAALARISELEAELRRLKEG